MTKNKLLLVSVFSSLGIVGVAAAQGHGAQHFQKLDTDGDGVVTTAEFEAGALARWAGSDANKDGKVTADEAKAHFEAHKREMFGSRDANGDGKLSQQELGKMPPERFAALDADGDGALSEQELAAFRGGKGKHAQRFGGKLPGDANGDGVITKDEALQGAQQLAKKLDADGDGKITQAELARGHHHAFGRHGRRAPFKAHGAPANDAD